MKTWRRRKTRVFSKYDNDGPGFDTTLEVYPDLIRLRQDRGKFAQNEIVVLDPPTMELLHQLWQEVKQ